jgi:capsule polysaccharide export protein KpsE/RkpR
MKSIALSPALLLAFCLLPIRADTEPTAFEKAVYDKARYQVLAQQNDDDFVSYCITMNFGGELLLKVHDDILVKQTELDGLLKAGYTADHPQVISLNNDLRTLRAELEVKVLEVRKGLQLEAKIAEATLSSLAQYQK